MNRLNGTEINNFDQFIEKLSKCQILNEAEVKVLCDKAKYDSNYLDKFLPKSLML